MVHCTVLKLQHVLVTYLGNYMVCYTLFENDGVKVSSRTVNEYCFPVILLLMVIYMYIITLGMLELQCI